MTTSILAPIVEGNRRYRSSAIVGTVVGGCIFAIWGGAIGIAGLTHPKRHTQGSVLVALLVVDVLYFVWLMAVVRRMGVVVSPAGVQNRSWFRSRLYRWSDVTGFARGTELTDFRIREVFKAPSLTTYLLLHDGQRVSMPGITTTRLNPAKGQAKMAAVIEQLRTEQRRYQVHAGA